MKMKRLASDVVRKLELRVARLERTSARPSMSPRRLIEEGMLEMRQEESQKEFKLFNLNERSILNFVKNNLSEFDTGRKKIVNISVTAYQPFHVDIYVNTISMYQSHSMPVAEYSSYSFDATVNSTGRVVKKVPDSDRDLTQAQFERLERKPVQIDFDLEQLQRAFPGFIFNK
tara:strand:- start:108 stop:626 length:519 start_codon:yes stop_codon:yes gene_type:complete